MNLERTEHSMRLRDKVAIVTGGASGIGKGICAALAREGARVAVADIDVQKADALAAELAAQGDAISVRTDVTSSSSANDMARKVNERFGRIDILVNNVGVRIVKPFLDHSDEDWNIMLATNLTGPFLCARAVDGAVEESASMQEKPDHIREQMAEMSISDRIQQTSSKDGRGGGRVLDDLD